MGNFYVNYTLRSPDQRAVAAALAGRASIVTPAQDGCIVVFDEESEDQNQEVIAELAARLSGSLGCPLLAVLNHDDDILMYQLFLNGELMDEYDSTPDYFGGAEEFDDESHPLKDPQGGNAKLLCEVFGANAVEEVENILRKPSLTDEGYVFAFERHADLAGALGIASFGVGTSFSALSDGELPEHLDERALLKTKDLIVTPPGGEAVESPKTKPRPGYYKVSFRAHPGLTKSIPAGWAPGLWRDLECSEQELSRNFQSATAAYREQFKALGFTEQGFKKQKLVLIPNSRDRGGINYLDRSRCHFGQLIYSRTFIPSQGAEMVRVIIAFTAVFANDVLSCTNKTGPSFDTLPNHKIIRILSDDVALIYRQFLDEIRQRTEQPRCFSEVESLRSWFDSNTLQVFEDNVRRGIWVRMSDYEVAVAKRDLAPEANSGGESSA
ncbi:MAG: hypothetical protein C5B50_25935 [Verrucomicrobia bacterium]|nr:MAG: hypothetical protein C5B50_25935 [Verrucomicrobiota bacterium]